MRRKIIVTSSGYDPRLGKSVKDPTLEPRLRPISELWTPGPWDARDGVVYDSSGYTVADTTQGPHLHWSHTGNDGHWGSLPGSHIEREEDEQFANASLIATAPIFADIAVRAQYLANERGGDYSSLTIDELCAFMAEYDDALSAASGEEPG